MATITGQGTTYNLPNFTGELYTITPAETPFLSAIGGLMGNQVKRTDSTEFEWQVQDRRTTTANNVALEGAAAPTAGEQSRANVTNVCEIHHRSINVSYTKLAATGLKSGTNNADPNPVQNELTRLELEAIAVDIEKSFLSGVYQKPANNATARQTRGILSAITTNVLANGGTPRAITKAIVDGALKTAFDNGARLPQDRTVFMVGSTQKLALSNVYATATLSQPTMARNIGGFALDTIVTDFGTFGVMLNRWMPAGQIAILDLSACRPVWLEIPGKGLLFVEPLSKTGSSEQYQLYGEVGLEYGAETFHAVIKDLS